MNTAFTLLLLLSGIGLTLIFFSMVMALYLKRHHLKVVDQLVIGHEMPWEIDNIFYSLMRITNYGGGFSCAWCAKRSKIAEVESSFEDLFKFIFGRWCWECLC